MGFGPEKTTKGGAPAVERAEGPWARAAACSAMGPRKCNEDFHVMVCKEPDPEPRKKESVASGGLFDDLPDFVAGPSLPSAGKPNVDCLFGVLDGHAGDSVARVCSERLPAEVREQLEASGRDTAESRRLAMEETCLALDRHLRFKLGPAGAKDTGSTCIFAFAWLEDDGDESERIRLLLVNLGDSRGLVLRTCGDDSDNLHEIACETSDHSPDVPAEELRISQAGGKVSRPDNIARVDGFLGCSRALGDFRFKEDPALLPENQKVSIVPDVYECRCGDGDVVVLACDGVWDVLSSSTVASLVSESIGMTSDPGDAAASVVQAALAAPGQTDNVTCVVALLNYPPNVANA